MDDTPRNTAAGHMRPFGSAGPFLAVDEVAEFPNTTHFFERYVFELRPLKMAGAGRLSAAFDRWSDAYLRSTTLVDADSTIVVETAKKENRSNPIRRLHFHEFLETYNSTEQYMVDNVPDELRQDVLLPGPLQCPQLYEEMLIEMLMWMSSGGTSSVVHTDAIDNIICVYRGLKRFIMIDPVKYKPQIIIDRPEGAYSAVDVDSVDYTLYPDLAHVSYHIVNVSAGDCLYIPYKWIHQARSSDDHSIAVSIWWNHYRNKELDLDHCPNDFDPNLTLDKVTFHGFESMNDDIEAMREHFADIIQTGVDVEKFVTRLIGSEDDLKQLGETTGYRLPFTQIFLIIDKDHDKTVTIDELNQLSEKDWTVIQQQMRRFEAILDAAYQQTELDSSDSVKISYSKQDEL
jgi:lysine-specific demethylase 8